MKKKYLKIALCMSLIIGLSISIQAQTDEKTSRELYQDYIDNIDINNLNTSFVLNKGFINDDEIVSLYQFIEAYDEDTNELVEPISQMDGVSWMQMYNRLLESEINASTKLPSIEELNTELDENYSSSTNIPILIFDVKGELLEDTEIENSIQSLPKEVPYNQVHLFGAISYINKSYKKNINFELNLENYFSSFDSKESDIFINFGDGNGVQEYSSSQGIISINYADLGEKVITVYRNANLNDVSMKIGSSFIIDIKADNTEDPTTIIQSTSAKSSYGAKALDDVIDNYGGKAHCFLGDDNVLDKPIIIIQGFDPIGEITLDVQREKYESFEGGLRNNNYDVVYLMLDNTNLSLQDNTEVVKDLIKKINSQKEQNFESILIGESMGGLLSRMALKQFENENYDHQVGLYVSFDAPHQGANLPPGLQHLFKDVLESRLVSGVSALLSIIDNTAIALTNVIISPYTGDRIPNLRDVLQINTAYTALASLNSPAAKSMLVRHIDPDGYFTSSQESLNTLGYPANSRNIALVNGSNQSEDISNDLASGDILIDFDLWKSDCNEFSLNAWSSSLNSNARVSQIKWKVGLEVPTVSIKWENKCIVRNPFNGNCILKTKVPVTIVTGTTCATTNLINKEKYYNFDGASYDNAPGSTLPGLDDLPFDLEANTTFVPTASAIDLSDTAYNSSTDPNGLTSITNVNVLDNFIINNQTPFDEVYSKSANSTHVFFNFDDFTNFNTIITDEFMFEDLDIQNKTITNDRDFEANNDINLGNDINTRTDKIFEIGDVIVNNNATVNFNANNTITLSPGTHFQLGSTVSLKTLNNTASNKASSKLNTNFQIKIVGANEYNIGKLPSFKVIASDTNTDYSYDWVLNENTQITSNNSEFIIDELLYPGTYSIKVEVTSKKTFQTETLTKTLKIKSDLSTYNNVENLVKTTNNISIYPNPVVDEVTIIAQKEILKIIVYDVSSKIILETNDTNKTWESFNLDKLTSGIYMVNVYFSDNTSVAKKLIKK